MFTLCIPQMFINNFHGVHSHISGFQPTYDEDINDSLYVCNNETKEAGMLIVKMIKTQIFGGNTFLITGPPGCGKTAFAVAIKQELGPKIPFVCVSSADFISTEIKQAEILEEFVRKTISVKIYETKNVHEGEVVAMTDTYVDLRSLKGTKHFNISTEIKEQLLEQSVRLGDVIHIDSSAGIVKNMGRGESHLNDYDLEAEKYVPLPKKEITKINETCHDTTLHDLDFSAVHPTHQDTLSLIHDVIKHKKTEMTYKLRQEVNKLVCDDENAVIVHGVLYIENCNFLSAEAFAYLSKVIDSPMAPIIILSSNRIQGSVGETEKPTPFGIPECILQRVVVIPLQKVNNEKAVINLRIQKEALNFDDDALQFVYDICKDNGLKYTISILSLLKGNCENITPGMLKDLLNMFKSVN